MHACRLPSSGPYVLLQCGDSLAAAGHLLCLTYLGTTPEHSGSLVHLCRRGKSFYELGKKTGHAPHYLSAFEDLTALSHPNESATELLGLCHGHILQHGGPEALARLGAATASKTGSVRHTPEALAAMGETGAGLSLEQMARHLSGASAADGLDVPVSGEPWAPAQPEAYGPKALCDTHGLTRTHVLA